MLFRRLALTLAGIVMAVGGDGLAADPPKPAADAPKVDALPAPKAIVIPGQGQIRVDRYAVWQAYGVDRFGQFRPLVVSTPWGAYYYANGKCFPWTGNYPQEFMRVRVD